MGVLDIFKPGKKPESAEEMNRLAVEAEKDRRWQRAKQQAEGGGQTTWDAPIPSSAIPNRAPLDDDTYDRKKHRELERLELGLPVESADIEPAVSRPGEVAVNPNAVGNARIVGHMSEEAPDGLEVSGALDPQMDAYIQTQMAEAQAAELAKDQDRKPVA